MKSIRAHCTTVLDKVRREKQRPLGPRFPAEIQDLIWGFAIQAIPARIVELRRVQQHDSVLWTGALSFISSAEIPTLLHVCRRSRELATRRWTLTFANQVKGDQPKVWFDFEGDTLLFLGKFSHVESDLYFCALTRTMPTDRVMIRNIAVHLNDFIQPLGDQWAYRHEWTHDVEDYHRDLHVRKMCGIFPGATVLYLVLKDVPLSRTYSFSQPILHPTISLYGRIRRDFYDYWENRGPDKLALLDLHYVTLKPVEEN